MGIAIPHSEDTTFKLFSLTFNKQKKFPDYFVKSLDKVEVKAKTNPHPLGGCIICHTEKAFTRHRWNECVEMTNGGG